MCSSPTLLWVRFEQGTEPGIEACVHRDIEHLHRLARAIAPRMIRPALDYDIPRFQVHLRIVEQHRDLAFEHDGIVDGLGAMHERMAAAATERRRLRITDALEHVLRLRR